MPYRARSCRFSSSGRSSQIFRYGLFARPFAAGLVTLGVMAVAPATAAAAVSAPAVLPEAAATGWLRLANLSPGTPMFDISLYTLGDSNAMLTLRNVGYGTVSGYRAVPAGNYTVAVRKAGSPASSPPVLSTTLAVAAGRAYTIASVGPSSAPRIEVLNDMLTTPKGKALVRIIQASLRQSRVTVSASGHVLVRDLAFGGATSYAAIAPRSWELRAAGPTMTATAQDTLAAGTSYTLVVLDGPGRLELDLLTDGSGSRVRPSGAAPTGFGGTAPRPAPAPLAWAAGVAAGVLITACGALWLRRTRPAA